MKRQVDIKPPMMPNFARFESNQNACIDIADFTREEAEQYADLMRDAFMKHWEKRKAQKKVSPQADNSQEK
jgi:hypothetical protein